MRLSLSINGRHVARAALEASGWLGAHVSLSHGIKSDEPASRVWLAATDISEEPNSVHSTWAPVPLSVGDKIEIEVLHDGEADPPSTITKTSASADNLFSHMSQARLCWRPFGLVMKHCGGRLSDLPALSRKMNFVKFDSRSPLY